MIGARDGFPSEQSAIPVQETTDEWKGAAKRAMHLKIEQWRRGGLWKRFIPNSVGWNGRYVISNPSESLILIWHRIRAPCRKHVIGAIESFPSEANMHYAVDRLVLDTVGRSMLAL